MVAPLNITEEELEELKRALFKEEPKDKAELKSIKDYIFTIWEVRQ